MSLDIKKRFEEIQNSEATPVKKMRALWSLAEYCEDAGDYDFAEEIYEARNSVIDPKTNKPFNLFGGSRFPHSSFHAHVPQVIIFKEKHGDRYFDASTPENTALACLYVLKERLTAGYFFSDELSKDVDPGDQLNLFKSNEKPLTEKQKVEKIISSYDKNDPVTLIRAGKMAADFLLNRSDYEYEGMEFEKAEVATLEDF